VLLDGVIPSIAYGLAHDEAKTSLMYVGAVQVQGEATLAAGRRLLRRKIKAENIKTCLCFPLHAFKA
jgi:hypothetical protein